MSNRVGRVLPDGVYPTMITPFLDDERKTVDWNCLDSMYELDIVCMVYKCYFHNIVK